MEQSTYGGSDGDGIAHEGDVLASRLFMTASQHREINERDGGKPLAQWAWEAAAAGFPGHVRVSDWSSQEGGKA